LKRYLTINTFQWFRGSRNIGVVQFYTVDNDLHYSFQAKGGKYDGLCFIKDLSTFELFFDPEFDGSDEYRFEFADIIDFGAEAILISPAKDPR